MASLYGTHCNPASVFAIGGRHQRNSFNAGASCQEDHATAVNDTSLDAKNTTHQHTSVRQ